MEARVPEDLGHTGAEGAGPGPAAGRTLTAGPEDGQEGTSFCDLR